MQDKKALAMRELILWIIGLVVLIAILILIFKSRDRILDLIEQLKEIF